MIVFHRFNVCLYIYIIYIFLCHLCEYTLYTYSVVMEVASFWVGLGQLTAVVCNRMCTGALQITRKKLLVAYVETGTNS